MRIIIAAVAVALALALLIVGAIALFASMNSSPDTPGASTSPGGGGSTQQQAAPLTARPVGPHALIIEVTSGGPVTVLVATPGNAKTLYSGQMAKGDIRVFDDPEMSVTVNPVQGTEVTIHGKVVSKGKSGKQSWDVAPK